LILWAELFDKNMEGSFNIGEFVIALHGEGGIHEHTEMDRDSRLLRRRDELNAGPFRGVRDDGCGEGHWISYPSADQDFNFL
jgi:hypothetical protein